MLKRHKFNEKKLLHKIGKHWCVVSIALLGLIGGVGVSQHNIHAQNVPAKQQTISQQSTRMHQHLIQDEMINNKANDTKQSSDKETNNNYKHSYIGKMTQMTVNYKDKNDSVGAYQYQGPNNEVPGVNTRDDIARHVPNGYEPVVNVDHLSSDITVHNNEVTVTVNKILTNKIIFTFNNSPIYTLSNQGGSDKAGGNKKDFLMDELHTKAENALRNHQSIDFFVPPYNQGERIRIDYSSINKDIDNYQANPQDVLNAIDQKYGSDPQEYNFKDITINIPLTKIPQPIPKPSDESDESDFYHTFTINYVDKDTNQKVGNSYVNSGENDAIAMPFSLINGVMNHIPSGYHYLYMQQPKFNPIPKQETLIATVEKNQSPLSQIQTEVPNNVDISSYNNEINNLRNQVASYSIQMNEMKNDFQSLKSEINKGKATHRKSNHKVRNNEQSNKNYRLPRTNSKYWNRVRHLRTRRGIRIYRIHSQAHHKNKIIKSRWIKANHKINLVRSRRHNKSWIVTGRGLHHYAHYYWIFDGDVKYPKHFKIIK